MLEIPHRLGLIQRVLPYYRVPFFEALAQVCTGGFSLFAGLPRVEEAIENRTELAVGQVYPARNISIPIGQSMLLWQGGLHHWLEEWQPEVLIVEANGRYLSIPAAVQWMHARHRPVIGWGLGAPAAGGLRSAVRRMFLGQFQALITYSAQGANEYRQAGFSQERVYVAPNAAAPRPNHPLPLRSDLTAPHQAVVLFVGRLQPRKRVDLLLRACAGLPPEIQPNLWIVGDGPSRYELEQLARQIYPRAVFVGAKHGAELDRFFLGADLFVLPGTGGLAVQQAMAYGLPVMVAEADGTQSDLLRPENGWQLPVGNLDGITAHLADALGNIPRLRIMGQESYRIAAEEVNIERMVEVFARAVNQVFHVQGG